MHKKFISLLKSSVSVIALMTVAGFAHAHTDTNLDMPTASGANGSPAAVFVAPDANNDDYVDLYGDTYTPSATQAVTPDPAPTMADADAVTTPATPAAASGDAPATTTKVGGPAPFKKKVFAEDFSTVALSSTPPRSLNDAAVSTNMPSASALYTITAHASQSCEILNSGCIGSQAGITLARTVYQGDLFKLTVTGNLTTFKDTASFSQKRSFSLRDTVAAAGINPDNIMTGNLTGDIRTSRGEGLSGGEVNLGLGVSTATDMRWGGKFNLAGIMANKGASASFGGAARLRADNLTFKTPQNDIQPAENSTKILNQEQVWTTRLYDKKSTERTPYARARGSIGAALEMGRYLSVVGVGNGHVGLESRSFGGGVGLVAATNQDRDLGQNMSSVCQDGIIQSASRFMIGVFACAKRTTRDLISDKLVGAARTIANKINRDKEKYVDQRFGLDTINVADSAANAQKEITDRLTQACTANGNPTILCNQIPQNVANAFGRVNFGDVQAAINAINNHQVTTSDVLKSMGYVPVTGVTQTSLRVVAGANFGDQSITIGVTYDPMSRRTYGSATYSYKF